VSLLTALLRDFGDTERDHLLTLIRTNLTTERDAAEAGAPLRAVDVGIRTRRSRRPTTDGPVPATT
jgi:hypothetical protein